MRIFSPLSPFTGAFIVVCGLGACQSSSSDYTSSYQQSRDQKMASIQKVAETEPPQEFRSEGTGQIKITYNPIAEPVPLASSADLKPLRVRENLEETETSPETDWVSEGKRHMESGSFEQAIVAFRGAVTTKPDNSAAWGNLGLSYIQTGERVRGIECLEESLSLSPDNTSFQASLIRAQIKEKNFDLALEQAQTLANLEPEKFRTHFLLGRAYSVNKMWKEAVGSFQKAIRIEPNHRFANNNLGYVALQIGENDVAVKALEQATDQENAPAFMFNSLGLAYERINKPVSAMTAFHKALEDNPRFVKAIVNRNRLSATLTPAQQAEFVAWRDDTPSSDEGTSELIAASTQSSDSSVKESEQGVNSEASNDNKESEESMTGDATTDSNQ